ncbi:hypothetical protein GCM10009795_049210 [Nocardioides hankookensis]|uniref:Uncharacterized protein n=1 Tax=Nocardioides hankookensis TaxID=443157 RepID=A0ABW1LGJ1_9ACTN
MMPTGRGARLLAAAYVVAVAVLTARAFSEADHDHWAAEIAAAVLTLPAIVPALPVIYVVGASAWNVGPMWVVTLTFTLLMTVVACANVLLLRWAWRSLRGRRAASDRTRSAA